MTYRLFAVLATASLAVAAGMANAQSTSVKAADNTGSNKQDTSDRNPTADDQKNNAADMRLTQQIRKSVMADKSLSMDAHNAKIISINGEVTLNGVVASDAEKRNLVQKAAQIAGAAHVVNQLKVKGQN
jgi:osmotically-inducible protein OsmY